MCTQEPPSPAPTARLHPYVHEAATKCARAVWPHARLTHSRSSPTQGGCWREALHSVRWARGRALQPGHRATPKGPGGYMARTVAQTAATHRDAPTEWRDGILLGCRGRADLRQPQARSTLTCLPAARLPNPSHPSTPLVWLILPQAAHRRSPHRDGLLRLGRVGLRGCDQHRHKAPLPPQRHLRRRRRHRCRRRHLLRPGGASKPGCNPMHPRLQPHAP